MKIRLEIAAGEHRSKFEHAGPTVRIGRDPDGELVLKGEASTGVSRNHVCIDLGRNGAVLRDAGSSNGTLVNDQLIKGAVTLAVRDRIGLGYAGPKLSVLELDVSTAMPEVSPSRFKASWVIWVTVAAAILLVITLAIARIGVP